VVVIVSLLVPPFLLLVLTLLHLALTYSPLSGVSQISSYGISRHFTHTLLSYFMIGLTMAEYSHLHTGCFKPKVFPIDSWSLWTFSIKFLQLWVQWYPALFVIRLSVFLSYLVICMVWTFLEQLWWSQNKLLHYV